MLAVEGDYDTVAMLLWVLRGAETPLFPPPPAANVVVLGWLFPAAKPPASPLRREGRSDGQRQLQLQPVQATSGAEQSRAEQSMAR